MIASRCDILLIGAKVFFKSKAASKTLLEKQNYAATAYSNTGSLAF